MEEDNFSYGFGRLDGCSLVLMVDLRAVLRSSKQCKLY